MAKQVQTKKNKQMGQFGDFDTSGTGTGSTFMSRLAPDWLPAFTSLGVEAYGGSWYRPYPTYLPIPDLFLRLSDGEYDHFPPPVRLNASAEYQFPKLAALRTPEVPILDLDWPDRALPIMVPTGWQDIVDEIQAKVPGLQRLDHLGRHLGPRNFVLQVACAGGRGRTGTALSIIYGMLTGVPDPVASIRTLYHQDAVETVDQVGYVERVLGITIPNSTYAATGFRAFSGVKTD